MRLIDTHCHYNMDPLWSDWRQHWAKAQAHGLESSVIAGADKTSCERGLAIAEQEPHLFPALGFHPEVYDQRVTELMSAGLDVATLKTEAEKLLAQDLAWMIDQSKTHRIIAVGETGLDYYYFKPEEAALNALKTSVQKTAFIAQIGLANQLKLPLIIHTRDTGEAAYRDALELLKLHYNFAKPFVFHCASGPLDFIAEAISLGGYVGFDGNLTYKKNDLLVELFTAVPTNRILLETDAPFLPPQEFRGKTCEPWMMSLTANYIQTRLATDPELCTTNAKTFFDL
jgi:TatD DNase family protein